jgi:hypothetical protein
MHRSVRVVVGIVIALALNPAWSAEYTGLVSDLQPNHNSQNCFFFRLSGVTINPASPGNWFAVAYTTFGAKETYATLLAAKLSDTPIKVTTLPTAPTVCNYAEATYVAF